MQYKVSINDLETHWYRTDERRSDALAPGYAITKWL